MKTSGLLIKGLDQTTGQSGPGTRAGMTRGRKKKEDSLREVAADLERLMSQTYQDATEAKQIPE